MSRAPGNELAAALAPVHAMLRELAARVEALERVTFPVTPEPDPPSTLARLELACREQGVPVSGDGFVSERDAAVLVGRGQSTLRAWRKYFDSPLPWRRLAGRTEYALQDLAAYLDEAARSR